MNKDDKYMEDGEALLRAIDDFVCKYEKQVGTPVILHTLLVKLYSMAFLCAKNKKGLDSLLEKTLEEGKKIAELIKNRE